MGFISQWGALAGRYAALCPPGWPWTATHTSQGTAITTAQRMPFHSPSNGKFYGQCPVCFFFYYYSLFFKTCRVNDVKFVNNIYYLVMEEIYNYVYNTQSVGFSVFI